MELKEILSIIEKELENLKGKDVDDHAALLGQKIKDREDNENGIYVYGAGRSGYVARSFVMRLMQLKLKAYTIGESSTPPISPDDLLIIISGSFKTQVVKDVVEISKRNEVETVLISSAPLEADNIDTVIPIYGKSKNSKDDFKTSLPLGSLFEINAFIFLELLIFKMVKEFGYEDRLREIGEKYVDDKIPVL